MFDDMSTSPPSSASAAASLYDASNAADGIIYKQQQQQHPTSSVSQRFHPYLAAYGRDTSSASTTAQSAAVVDHGDPNRGGLQYVSDLLGPGPSGPANSADSSYSGRRAHHHGHQTGSGSSNASRRLREFIPDHKKDDEYWMKRQKNNEAAKRSREKRRINDMVMTKKILELTTENKRLRVELDSIKRQYGLVPDTHYPVSDEVSADRSISPLCVGISSSDDSTPPPSFGLYQSASRSSPSPPMLDRYYAEPTSNVRPNYLEGKVLAPASQVSCASSQEQYQPIDGYRHQLPGQQQQQLQFVLHPHLAMQNTPQHQQQQQLQQQVPFSKSISSAVETAALLRPFQFTSTSAKISHAPLSTEQPVSGDSVCDPVCGNQMFQSKLRNPCLTEDVPPSSQTHVMASASCSLVRDPQQVLSAGHRVKVSAAELQSLAFSDLSSDDDDDDGEYRPRLLGSDAPLNLTKRPLLWPPVPSMSSFSNSSYVAQQQPVNLLRNDGEKPLPAAYYARELPLSPMIEQSELRFWMQSSSKELFENNSSAGGSLSRPVEQLRNPTVRETAMFDVSERLSSCPVASSGAGKVLKFESGNGMSVDSAAAKRLRESCDEEPAEPPVTTDLAVDALVQTPSRQVRGGVPLKVWHKRSALFAAGRSVDFEQEDFRMSATTSGDISFMDDEDRTGTLAALSPNSSPSSDSLVNYSSELSDSDSVQGMFRKRRLRSMTVRKCRENRKLLLTNLNMTTATILESENHKLKEELRSLSREVTDLKEMIGKKDPTRNGTQIQGAI